MEPFIYPLLKFSAVFNALTYATTFSVVFLKKSKRKVDYILLLLYFSAGLWSLGYFFPFTRDDAELSLFSFRVLHFGALFLGVIHAHFICEFLNVSTEKRWMIRFGYFLNFLLLPFVFSPIFILGQAEQGPMRYFFTPGPLYGLWLFFWIFYFAYSLYLEVKHFFSAKGIQQVQLKYLIFATILAVSAGSTNILFAYGFPFPPYLTIFASLHAIILAYVILKYRFLDIRVTFSNWGKSILSYFVAFLCASFSLALTSDFVFPLDFLIVSAVFLFAYLKARQFFDGPNFYKLFQLTDIVHLKRLLDAFVAQNTFYEQVSDLNEELEALFRENLKYSSARVLPLVDKEDYPHLRRHFTVHKGTFLVTKEVAFQDGLHKSSHLYLSELEALGELCFPLFKGGKELIGFFVLGKKPFDDVYLQSELPLLEQFAHYLALLLGMTLYNVHLQREIAHKTLALREQNKEVKKLYELEKETTALLSHELKTPIAMVSNTHWYLEQFLEEQRLAVGKLYFPLKNFSVDLKEGLQKLNTICNSIFHLREVEYQMSKELQKLDWPRQILPLLDTIQQRATAKGIAFSYAAQMEDKSYYGACIQFEQVLTILLDNAVKYTDKGRVHLEIGVRQGSLICSVQDTGPGVSADLRHSIFKRFYRAKGAKTKQGLGLGLYIAKKILDQIGGSICVDSKPKKGSEFVIALPLTIK